MGEDQRIKKLVPLHKKGLHDSEVYGNMGLEVTGGI
jgi:hypothetical protein